MYRSDLDRRDKGGAIAAVVAIHAALLFALLQATGRIDVTDPQNPIRVFDVTETPPPPPTEPVQQQERQAERPEKRKAPQVLRTSEARQLQSWIRSRGSSFRCRCRWRRRRRPTKARSRPRARPTCRARDGRRGHRHRDRQRRRGKRNRRRRAGGDAVTPPRLLTPTLTGRDFPRELIRAWPRGAQVFVRVRVTREGGVSECIIDRGTGIAAIDSTVCNLVRQRFRYRPALNAAGQPVAGWHGYRQVPPR
jgi:periplasmic protein TonB